MPNDLRTNSTSEVLARLDSKCTAVAPVMTAPAGAPSGLGTRNVCIVTPDIVGPVRNGGIGTACEAIARTWSDAGHKVTILFVTEQQADNSAATAWAVRYSDQGIKLVLCPASRQRLTNPAPMQLSYNAWRWLKNRQFDLIYFPEWKGLGHYTLAARRAGIGLRATTIVVGTHSPTLWHLEGNQQLPSDIGSLCTDALERQSVEAADVVVSPSNYMLEWFADAGWTLPRARHVVPNPLPTHAYGKPTSLTDRRVKELVFFGRLETRKGLYIFLSALKSIETEVLKGVRVTFLGKGDEATINKIYAAKVPGVLSWNVLADKDAAGATDYVSAPGRLAVLPSLYENSSVAVAECIGRGTSFLASDVGGTADLLHPDDRASHLVQPSTSALTSALSNTLRNGLPPAARPATTADAIEAMWRSIVDTYTEPRTIETARCDWPMASIVLVTRNRPTTLLQALDGIRAQTWPNIEVILVDDGSDSREAMAVLDGLETEFAQRGWTIVRQQNRYLGAARNLGWQRSAGEYVVFHDDDNVSLPHLVETYIRAAQKSAADIVTAAMAIFEGDDLPDDGIEYAEEIFAPLGGVLSAGVFMNLYGDAHACIRRDALERLGGFSEDYGVGHEDWELFARATIKGMNVLSVPEPLFWYRISKDSMLRTSQTPEANLLRSGRPFLQLLPVQYRAAMAYALALSYMSTTPQCCQIGHGSACAGGDSALHRLAPVATGRCGTLALAYYRLFSRPVIGPLLSTIRRSILRTLSRAS